MHSLGGMEMVHRLWHMLQAYALQAWPFLAGHIIIFVTTWRGPWREIRSEIRALTRWSKTQEKSTECTRVLNEFVEETRLWGSQGILVPMTDFTDRLDSKTTGLIDSLHSRVNLFLVLGIAGTFFAMFQFAADAVKHLPGPDSGIAASQIAGQLVAKELADHLSMAFPVGFFGLVLTIIGHFVAFRADNQLRSALTSASQDALKVRREAVKGQATAIQDALQPLSNIHEVLQSSLRPVFHDLQEQLQATAGVLKEQVTPLSIALERFEKSAIAVAATTELLTQAAKEVPEALRSVRDLQSAEAERLNRLHEIELGMREALQRAAQDMQGATRELTSAAAALRDVPEAMRQQITADMAQFFELMRNMWQENGEKLLNALRPAQDELVAASGQMRSAVDALEKTPAQLVKVFSEQVSGLLSQALQTWKDQGSQFVNQIQADLQARLELIRADSKAASESLRDGADALQGAAGSISEVVRNALKAQLEEGMKELQPVLVRLQEAIEIQYPAALNNLKEAADRSAELAKQAGLTEQTMRQILTDMQSANQQLANARLEVERALADLRHAPAMISPPDPRPDIDRVRVAIVELTDVVRGRTIWNRLFGRRQVSGRQR